jgi:hypothetical protein
MAELFRAVKTACATFFGHRFFIPLTLTTIAFVILSASLFLLTEAGENANVSSFADALRWVLTGLPFFGRVTIEPVTLRGTIVAIAMHAFGLLLFTFWVALLGVSLFGRRRRVED